MYAYKKTTKFAARFTILIAKLRVDSLEVKNILVMSGFLPKKHFGQTGRYLDPCLDIIYVLTEV